MDRAVSRAVLAVKLRDFLLAAFAMAASSSIVRAQPIAAGLFGPLTGRAFCDDRQACIQFREDGPAHAELVVWDRGQGSRAERKGISLAPTNRAWSSDLVQDTTYVSRPDGFNVLVNGRRRASYTATAHSFLTYSNWGGTPDTPKPAWSIEFVELSSPDAEAELAGLKESHSGKPLGDSGTASSADFETLPGDR